MEWIRLAIEFFTICVANGVFFYSINRKLKHLEVEDKKTDILKKQDDEWQELYQEEKSRVQPLQERVESLIQEKSDLSKALNLKEVELARLQGDFKNYKQQSIWYRCTVDNCANRRPPHVFDVNGVEHAAKEESHE